MRDAARAGSTPWSSRRSRTLCLMLGALAAAALLCAGQASAQAREDGSKPVRVQPRNVEAGPRWSELTRAQRAALQPLAASWSSVDAVRKHKWLEVADRFGSLPADEQARIQARMRAWADLTPQQRGRARQQFQEARRVPPQQRLERWDAYQALPPEQRSELVDKASKARRSTTRQTDAPGARRGGDRRSTLERRSKAAGAATTEAPQTLPNTDHPLPAKPVGPTVVQIRPGATTTLMSRRPGSPPQRPIGLPKMTSMPESVDSNTLLPRRGAKTDDERAPRRAATVPERKPGR